MTETTRLLEHMDMPEVVNVSGALALLLQFAHPLTAAGVASTRKFQETPRLRLQHTSSTLQALMTSNTEQAAKLASQLAVVHGRINGTLSENVGKWKAGTPYAASDPQLILWVYTTLVVSRVEVFSALARPLSNSEKEAFYQSTLAFAKHFGITDALRPSTYKELFEYYQGMLEDLAVGTDGYNLAQAFFAGVGPGSSAMRVVIGYFLPDAIRLAYGISWGRYRELQARIYMPLVIPFLPALRWLFRLWYQPWTLQRKVVS